MLEILGDMVDRINNWLTQGKGSINEVKFIGYSNLDEYQRDKNISSKRVENIRELFKYYGLNLEKAKIEIETVKPKKLEEDTPENRYKERREEMIFKINYNENLDN